jgi:hypothetical protein
MFASEQSLLPGTYYPCFTLGPGGPGKTNSLAYLLRNILSIMCFTSL